jgi:hypothetical protein
MGARRVRHPHLWSATVGFGDPGGANKDGRATCPRYSDIAASHRAECDSTGLHELTALTSCAPRRRAEAFLRLPSGLVRTSRTGH